MLRVLLLAALCSEAASVLAGVREAHQASAQEISSAIHNIGDSLNAISIPGKARQMAINAMMRSVASSDKLDDDTKGLLQNITVLLQNILEQMQLQRDEDQMEIDGINAAVSRCNSQGVQEDDDLKAVVGSTATNHTECRAQEETLFDDDAAKCLALTDYMRLAGSPHCHKPDPTQDALHEWDALFTTGLNYFEMTKEGFEPKRDACLASGSALADKIEECGQKQNGYENHFCEWHLHRKEMCAQLDTCYANAIEAHENTTSRIRPLSEQRVREAGVIEHIVCLITNLVAGETDRELCVNAINETGNQATYGNTFPDPLPSKRECTTTEVDIYPGGAGWYDFAYSALSPKTPADVSTGIAC